MTERISSDVVEKLLRRVKGLPGVHILKAPPGDGKTQAVMEALAALRKAEGIRRVLYATHATLSEDAVGREVQSRFRRVLGAPPTIVRGRKHFTNEEKYEEQFRRWRQGVKIIAHAHLPTVFNTGGSKPSTCLRQAELLVIDEDALSSLLVCSSEDFKDVCMLRCDALRKLPDLDPFMGAVVALWQDILAGRSLAGVASWNSWEDNKAADDHHTLTGEEFWAELTRRVPSPDWHALYTTLTSINAELGQREREERLPVQLLVDTVREDFDAFSQGRFSHRFGLYWKGDPKAATFRFDVRVPIHLPCPVLVLDAYADEELYGALFDPHPVTLITDFDRRLPLEIEVAQVKPFIRRDFSNPKKETNKRSQVARKVVELIKGSDRKALVLAPMKFNEQHPWTDVLTDVLRSHDALSRVGSTHWWAGRGKNAWSGWHVVAVYPPYLPRTHRDHTLAALFPYDPEARERAARHIQQSELLQMLHRGRQPHVGAANRPRVVTFFEPDLPEGTWARVPYRSSVTLAPRKQLNGWADAVRALSEELLQAFGCVPLFALETLGLLRPRSDDTERQAELTANLHRAIRRSAGTELRYWKRKGQLKTFRIGNCSDPDYIGVRRRGANSRDDLYALLEDMDLRRLAGFNLPVDGARVWSGIVFVPESTTQADILPALRLLLAGKPVRSDVGNAATRENFLEIAQVCA